MPDILLARTAPKKKSHGCVIIGTPWLFSFSSCVTGAPQSAAPFSNLSATPFWGLVKRQPRVSQGKVNHSSGFPRHIPHSHLSCPPIVSTATAFCHMQDAVKIENLKILPHGYQKRAVKSLSAGSRGCPAWMVIMAGSQSMEMMPAMTGGHQKSQGVADG